MIRNYILGTVIFSLLIIITGCDSSITDSEAPPDVVEPQTVEITASHDQESNEHLFDLSTDEIASGWTTFEFTNASHADHFVLLYKVPDEGIAAAEAAGEPLLDHWYNGVTVPFQEEYTPFVQGEINWEEFVDNLVANIAGKALWFFDPGAPPSGGPGLTAAGLTSRTTVSLSPGTYIVECYVKDEAEEFHSFNGMLRKLVVTEEVSDGEAPEATMEVTIAQPASGGLSYEGTLGQGEQVISVFFDEQPEFGYEHLLGHNAQLFKLEDPNDEGLLEELAIWIDWRLPGSFTRRAPEGATFIGGAMEMVGGETAYLHVDLSPGDYAWIAEVPAPAEKGMVRTFTIE